MAKSKKTTGKLVAKPKAAEVDKAPETQLPATEIVDSDLKEPQQIEDIATQIDEPITREQADTRNYKALFGNSKIWTNHC